MPRVMREPTINSSFEFGTGSGLSNSASTTLKMATFAPDPNAIDTIAIAANTGCFTNMRPA